MSYAISGSMAIITNVINYIIGYSVEVLADMESHKTKSERSGSLLLKIVITQTLNTSIIYSILYFIKPIDPLSTYGLVTKINSLVLVSGFISVVWQVLLPTYTITAFLNARNYTPDRPINLFQIQLNAILEKPSFSYAQSYSFYIIYTYVVAWYGFLVPMATPILFVYFILQYWVDKYNLFRRFSTPVPFGQDLVTLVNRSFEFNLFMFAVGFFIWQSSVHFDTPTTYRVINIITLFIATAWVSFSIFVPRHIKDKMFGEQAISYERLTYTYYRSQGQFAKTYFRESPATFCLKETKIIKKKELHAGGEIEAEDVPEAPDPEFIR
jgi:hypothetical protein